MSTEIRRTFRMEGWPGDWSAVVELDDFAGGPDHCLVRAAARLTENNGAYGPDDLLPELSLTSFGLMENQTLVDVLRWMADCIEVMGRGEWVVEQRAQSRTDVNRRLGMAATPS